MNAVVDRMSPNITTMIRMDHSHVMALFHRFKADTPATRKEVLVKNACLALQIHAQLEEEIFYPALRSVMSSDEVLDKSEPEHEEMRRLMGELRRHNVGDQSFDDKFMDLIRVVMHHVADEETRLLPAAERLLSDQLGQLGARMTRRRLELLKPHAGEVASMTARSFPAGTAMLAAGAVAVGAMLMTMGKSKGNGKSMPRRWSR